MAYSVTDVITKLKEYQNEIEEVFIDGSYKKLSNADIDLLKSKYDKVSFMLQDIEDQKLLSRGPQDVYTLLDKNTDVLQEIFGDDDFWVEEPKSSSDVFIDNDGNLRWTEDAIMKYYGIKPLDNGKYTDKQKMDFFTNVQPDLAHYNKYAYETKDGKRQKSDEALSIDEDKSKYAKEYMREKAFQPSEQEGFGGMLASGIAKYMFPSLWQAAKDGKYDDAESKSDLVFNTDMGRDFATGVTYGLTPFKGTGKLATFTNAATVPAGWATYDAAVNDKPLDEALSDAAIGTIVNMTYPRYFNKQTNEAASKFGTEAAKEVGEITASDYAKQSDDIAKALAKARKEIKSGELSKESSSFIEKYAADDLKKYGLKDGFGVLNLDDNSLKELMHGIEMEQKRLTTIAENPSRARNIDRTLETISEPDEIARNKANSPYWNPDFDKSIAALKLEKAGRAIGDVTSKAVKPIEKPIINETFNKMGDFGGDAAIKTIPFVNTFYEGRQDAKAQAELERREQLAKARQESLNRQWRYQNGKMTPQDAKMVKEAFDAAIEAEKKKDPNWQSLVPEGFENAFNMYKANLEIKPIKTK